MAAYTEHTCLTHHTMHGLLTLSCVGPQLRLPSSALHRVSMFALPISVVRWAPVVPGLDL